MDGSVKAQVIALATKDPFLTVEELAQIVGTTNRYVRTILSEADLSLDLMRRNYARILEKRLGEQREVIPLPAEGELQIKKIPGSEISEHVGEWSKQEIFQASAFFKTGDQIRYEQLITPERIDLKSHYSGLRELLPSESSASLVVNEQKAEILWAPDNLSSALGCIHSSQVFKLTTVLHSSGLPHAIEICWFSLDGLVLRWSGEEPEVKISLIS